MEALGRRGEAGHLLAAYRRNPADPEPGGTIPDLTSKQRAYLRSLAHSLKPVVHVGIDGVNDAVLRSVDEAFNTRELLKLKVQDGAPQGVDGTADAVADGLDGVHIVQTIGKTAVLYRPFPEDPELRLPG